MTLDSEDRIFFDVTPTYMALQVVSFENLGDDDSGCDTVVLHGCDVALFLHRLTTADACGCVVEGAPGSSKLLVKTLHDDLGMVTVVLETDDNVIHMKAYERDMLVSAIESQVWRLFQ